MPTARYSTTGGAISFGPNSIATGKGGAVNLNAAASHSSGSTETELAPSESELDLKLVELQHQYGIAKLGLLKGGFAAGGALISGLATLGAALFAFLERGPGFLSGTQLVLLFGLMIAGLLVYFSFVFRRLLRLRLEINRTKAQLHVASSEDVRNRS